MRIIPCLLAICGLAAADRFDDEFDLGLRSDGGQTALVAVYEQPLDRYFAMGSISGEWTQAERVGGEFRIFQQPSGSLPVESWGGFLVAWDTRKGDLDGGGHVDADALMVMAEGGISADMLPTRMRRSAELDLSLFGRAGLGFQDGRVTGLQTQFGPATGELAPIRYELAMGTELQLTLARKLHLFAGVGVTWFMASQSTMVSAGGSGSTVAVSAEFVGAETWGRMGAGVRF